MAAEQLSKLRDLTEDEINVPSGDSYIDSTRQLDDINTAYEFTAYNWNWPQTLIRRGVPIVANNQSYTTPSSFRKFRHLFVRGVEHDEVDFAELPFSKNAFAVDINPDFKDFWITTQPTDASDEYALTNNESAGNAVVIELDTVSGLAVGDEIYVDGTTPEFTIVAAVDTSAKTVTARLKAATGASKKLYRSNDIITFQYYRLVTLLSASTDTTILPDATDRIIPVYAAYLYFDRLEEKDRAQAKLDKFNRLIETAWRGHDALSTGHVAQFSI